MDYDKWCRIVQESELQEKRSPKMDIKNVLTVAADSNKSAMKQAGLIKIGKTANTAMVDVLSEKLLPKKYKKLAENEFFALAVSNLAAAAMKQASTTPKTMAVADAMILSSMIDITNLIDFNQIIKDVIKDVDLSSLGIKDNI